jgi:hypothetical protein
VATFYCLRFETSIFVASYDSQGHGGGIRPRLHTGRINQFTNELSFIIWGKPTREHHLEEFVLFCFSFATKCAHRTAAQQWIIPCPFVAAGMCLASRWLAMDSTLAALFRLSGDAYRTVASQSHNINQNNIFEIISFYSCENENYDILACDAV